MKILAVGSDKTITEELINRGGMKMTICDNCIHDEVCGIEGHLDEALVFCAHRSVDAQPMRSGQWIFDENPEFGNPYGSYVCSKCGYRVAHKENYCPKCGFIMSSE